MIGRPPRPPRSGVTRPRFPHAAGCTASEPGSGAWGCASPAGVSPWDRKGPGTLRALAQAPISSALPPNRYRTSPSSRRTCLQGSSSRAKLSRLCRLDVDQHFLAKRFSYDKQCAQCEIGVW